MRRFLSIFVLVPLVVGVILVGVAACSSNADVERVSTDPDAAHRDGAAVDPPDSAGPDAGSLPVAPGCATYCDTVAASCTGDQAQYASTAECLAFCARLPTGAAGDSTGDSVACREFYAGSPARTDSTYCGAAGPFGGGTCGDRCPIFCELTLGACAADAGPKAPYASYSDCQTACVGFGYRDGGLDGGGESTMGPTEGNTLNCRLFYLRAAVVQSTGCENLAVDSPTCL